MSQILLMFKIFRYLVILLSLLILLVVFCRTIVKQLSLGILLGQPAYGVAAGVNTCIVIRMVQACYGITLKIITLGAGLSIWYWILLIALFLLFVILFLLFCDYLRKRYHNL